MTTSSVSTLAEDLHGILSSFGSMLEGVYHVDDELAAIIAEKFADRLRNDVRAIYAEMTAEISEGLKKPPKKRRARRKVIEDTSLPIDEIPDRMIGAEELPANENTLVHITGDGDPDLLAAGLLNSDRITDRAGRPGPPNTNSWDNDNPTMRRIGK